MSTSTPCDCETVSTGNRIEYSSPRADLHQDSDGYTLELEMPGVSKSGVEVTVEDGKLTLIGRRTAVETPGRALHRESPTTDYRRGFDLDPGIDTEKVTASIDQGLLTVRLAKAEAVKPRRITVN